MESIVVEERGGSSTATLELVTKLPASNRNASKPTFPANESDLAKALRVFQQASCDLAQEVANTARRDLKVLAVDEPPDGAVLVLVGFGHCQHCHNFRIGAEAVNGGCIECVGGVGNPREDGET